MHVNIHLKWRAAQRAAEVLEAAGLEARLHAVAARFDAIESGIAALQAPSAAPVAAAAEAAAAPKRPVVSSAALEPCARDTPEVARLRALCKTLPLSSALFKWVPAEYYSRPLQWRRDVLEAPSISYLCKTIVMENTHCTNEDCSDRNNSRFYLVVFQYTERFDSEKLARFARDLNPGLGKKKFNFRLAAPERSLALTGFGYNSVVPFGTAVPIPVILSDRITKLAPAYFWMGGGHADCKVRVDVDEFVSVVQPHVADITNPLTEEELLQIVD